MNESGNLSIEQTAARDIHEVTWSHHISVKFDGTPELGNLSPVHGCVCENSAVVEPTGPRCTPLVFCAQPRSPTSLGCELYALALARGAE